MFPSPSKNRQHHHEINAMVPPVMVSQAKISHENSHLNSKVQPLPTALKTVNTNSTPNYYTLSIGNLKSPKLPTLVPMTISSPSVSHNEYLSGEVMLKPLTMSASSSSSMVLTPPRPLSAVSLSGSDSGSIGSTGSRTSPMLQHTPLKASLSPKRALTPPPKIRKSKNAMSPSSAGIKESKRYQCQTCYKCFTTSGHLARHTRIHTGERKHVCPFPNCESRFARQDNCMQHYRTHLDEGKRKKKSGS